MTEATPPPPPKPTPASLGVPVGLVVGTDTTRLCLGSLSHTSPTTSKITSAVISNEDGERFTPSFATMDDGFQVIGSSAKKILAKLHSTPSNNGNMNPQSILSNPSTLLPPFLSHMFGLAIAAGSIPESEGPDRVRVVIAKKDTPTTPLNDALLLGFSKKSPLSYLDENVAVVLANGLSHHSQLQSSAELPPPAISSSWKTAVVVNIGASGYYLSEISNHSSLINLVKSTSGASVSGEAIVDIVFKFVASQFTRKNPGLVVDSKKSIAKLREAVVSSLKVLGLSRTAAVEVDGLVEGVDCRVNLSRGRVEMLCGSTMTSLEETLTSFLAATSSPPDVILMAGGVCKMPCVKDIIKKVGGPTPYYGLESLSPDEAVVTGCSIQATLLNHSGLLSFDENTSLLPINGTTNGDGVEISLSSFSLSIGLNGGDKTTVLPASTPLGVTCFGTIPVADEDNTLSVFLNDEDKKICDLSGVPAGDCTVGLKVNFDGSVDVTCGGTTLTLDASA